MTDNIFKYFEFEEMTRSTTAEKLNIDNNPNDDVVIANIMYTLRCLDTIREAWGQPIYISSGYRSYPLNKAIRGAKTSQHVQGEAADITTKGEKNNMELYKFIRDGYKFDQLICEKPNADNTNCGWVHVSFLNEYTANRGEALIFSKGRYIKDINKTN